MTGNGTITFDTGEIITVTASMSCADTGPIGGTQSFSSTSGESGTMTFNADGSMDGVVMKNGARIATMHIAADGNGTFTDLSTGQTYAINDAKPSAVIARR
jgi:hypothetical protein